MFNPNHNITPMESSFMTIEELNNIGFKSLGKNLSISKKFHFTTPGLFQ